MGLDGPEDILVIDMPGLVQVIVDALRTLCAAAAEGLHTPQRKSPVADLAVQPPVAGEEVADEGP